MGKKREVLPLFITVNAWLVEPFWLRTGFELRLDTDVYRDYFLVMPDLDLEGARKIEAQF